MCTFCTVFLYVFCSELRWVLFIVVIFFWMCSLLTEADAGHTEFTDEVYENESRYPGGEWKASEESFTDVVRVEFFTG